MPRKRLEQFAYLPNFVYGSFYQNLLASATALLELAPWDRLRCAKNEQTHASSHAPGAIILSVTAFDIWLNEIITGLPLMSEEEARNRLDCKITAKFKFVHERLHGPLASDQPDLRTVVEIRHEIVHHFPRPDQRLIPDWFPELQGRGLLVTHPSGKTDYSLTQKLGSYALAYWVFQVLDVNASSLVEGSTVPHAQMRESNLHNFRLYRRVCHPTQLPSFDAKHRPNQTLP